MQSLKLLQKYNVLSTFCYRFKKCVEHSEQRGGKFETLRYRGGFAPGGLGQRSVLFGTGWNDGSKPCSPLERSREISCLLRLRGLMADTRVSVPTEFPLSDCPIEVAEHSDDRGYAGWTISHVSRED